MAPQFQNTPLTISKGIGILGINISSDVLFHSHLEIEAKLSSIKLGVLKLKLKLYFGAKTAPL